LSYHVVSAESDGRVTALEQIQQKSVRINGGYFVFRREIFDYLHDGEGLVCEPFERLIQKPAPRADEYDGVWMSMETFKDRQQLEEIHGRGNAPWQLWNRDVAKRDRPASFRPVPMTREAAARVRLV